MSVGFWSWSRFLAVSLRIINPTVGCHYFPPGPQLPMQPLRGLRPMSLLGEQRHDATSSGNWTVSTTADSPSDANELPVEDWLTILAAASCCRTKLVFLISTHTHTHSYKLHWLIVISIVISDRRQKALADKKTVERAAQIIGATEVECLTQLSFYVPLDTK